MALVESFSGSGKLIAALFTDDEVIGVTRETVV